MNYLSKAYIYEKWNHTGFQKYFRNTGWMFGGRVFSLVVSFFIGAYIARYLGPENYGLFNYVVSFVGLFGFLASFGIDGIVSREIIKNHDSKDKLIGTSFFLKLIGGIVAIITTISVAYFTTTDSFTFLLIILFSLSFIPQAFNIIETYFQSQTLSKNVVRAQIFATIISTLLKVLIVILNKGIFWLTFIYVIETSLIALFLLISFKYYGHHFRVWRFDFSIAKSLLKDSWPLMLSTVAISMYMKIDQVMIKNILGNTEVGLYAAAAKLSEIWHFIPVLITTSVFPVLVNTHKSSENELNKRMSKLYFLMFWSSTMIAISVTILARPIIEILFGPEYLGSIVVLQIYVWSGIAVFIGCCLTKYLLVNNLNKVYFYNTFFSAIVNIILNIILIPQLGISGAAIATLISYMIAIFGILLFKETRKHGLLIIKSIFNPR